MSSLPSSFTPILALIGVILYMFTKKHTKKDTGIILLGFATLMFGMETMTSAVTGLADVPQFQQLFLMFKNPALGLLAGALLTAIIQLSSASVGVLQALAMTGQVSYGAAIPIVMGTQIGTCVTALLSTMLLLPISSILEKIAVKIIPDAKYEKKPSNLMSALLQHLLWHSVRLTP